MGLPSLINVGTQRLHQFLFHNIIPMPTSVNTSNMKRTNFLHFSWEVLAALRQLASELELVWPYLAYDLTLRLGFRWFLLSTRLNFKSQCLLERIINSLCEGCSLKWLSTLIYILWVSLFIPLTPINHWAIDLGPPYMQIKEISKGIYLYRTYENFTSKPIFLHATREHFRLVVFPFPPLLSQL